MRFWRVATGPNWGLDGEGARLYGGRWNSEGVAVVYASTHLSLAVLEVLVHVPPHLWPETAQAFSINVPDSVAIDRLGDPASGPRSPDECKAFGDLWITTGAAHAIIVPSVVIPVAMGAVPTDEANALLNPRFAADWAIEQAPIKLDDRLRRKA
jgi:RES domain-containing protein